jgi:hypothetical protein
VEEIGLPDQRPWATGESSQQQPLGRREVDRDSVAVGKAGIKVALQNRGCSRGLNPASSRSSGDIVGEVAEPQGTAAEMFESSVDRLSGPLLAPGRPK